MEAEAAEAALSLEEKERKRIARLKFNSVAGKPNDPKDEKSFLDG